MNAHIKYADAVAENPDGQSDLVQADQRLLCDGAFHPDGNACGATFGELALYKRKGRSGYADHLHHPRPWTRKTTDSGIAVHRQPGHGGFSRKEVGDLLDEPELVRPTERAILAMSTYPFDRVTFRYNLISLYHF